MIHTLRNAELMNRCTDPRHTAEQVTFHVKKIRLQLRFFETGNETVVYFHCTTRELNLYLPEAFKNLQIMNMVRIMLVLGNWKD